MSTETTRQVVQRFLDALQSGNVNDVKNSFLDDAEIIIHSDTPVPHVGTFRGITEIMRGLSLREGRPSQDGDRFRVVKFIAEEEKAAVEWETLTDRFGNASPYNYSTLFELNNDKISRMIVYE